MAFIPVPNVAKFAIIGNELDAQLVNTLYFGKGSGWNASDLNTAAQALYNWYAAEVMPLISVGVSLQRVEARDISVPSGAVATYSPTPPVPGGQTNPALPNSVTLCISFRTGFAGRSFRGRNYTWPVTENQVDGNRYTVATADGFVDAYDQLFNVASSFGGVWVVVSRYNNGAPRETSLLWKTINTAIVYMCII